MQLRCKFVVYSVKKETGCRILAMRPVYGDANKHWSSATPSGEFEIVVTNQAAFPEIDKLEPQDEYYLDLTPSRLSTAGLLNSTQAELAS